MGIFDFLKIKNETVATVDDVLLKALLDSEVLTRRQAMNIPSVAGYVELISNTFAMIPFELYRETNKNNKKITEKVSEDLRNRIVNYETGDSLDGFQFKKAICEDYLLGKGGYAYIKKERNKIIGLNYVEDMYVQIYKNTDKINKQIEFMIDSKKYKSYEFIKLLRNTKDGASGIGLIEQINNSLSSAFQRIRLELDLMKTGGSKKGFLMSKSKLDIKSMEALKKAWNEYYSGNSSCVILNDGMEFKESSNNSVENQLNQKTKTFSDEMKEIFQIGKDYDDFIKRAIMPIANAFCIALNRDCLLEKEKNLLYFAPDFTELMKGSIKERYEAYKIAIDSGFLTRNEVRYKEDLDKLVGLDVINLGLGSVLLNPETGDIYTPNTDKTSNVGGGDKNG